LPESKVILVADIVVEPRVQPPIVPLVAVIAPEAFTVKTELKFIPVDELIDIFPLDRAVAAIVHPPIAPVVAVIFPDISAPVAFKSPSILTLKGADEKAAAPRCIPPLVILKILFPLPTEVSFGEELRLPVLVIIDPVETSLWKKDIIFSLAGINGYSGVKFFIELYYVYFSK